jgi:hypothetical protein
MPFSRSVSHTRLLSQYGTDDQQIKNNAVLAMAVLAGLGLSLGVSRHYYDIAKHRTVRGISWGFVFLDAAGDLTSLLAVSEFIVPPSLPRQPALIR